MKQDQNIHFPWTQGASSNASIIHETKVQAEKKTWLAECKQVKVKWMEKVHRKQRPRMLVFFCSIIFNVTIQSSSLFHGHKTTTQAPAITSMSQAGTRRKGRKPKISSMQMSQFPLMSFSPSKHPHANHQQLNHENMVLLLEPSSLTI